jgi:hypothetical protein
VGESVGEPVDELISVAELQKPVQRKDQENHGGVAPPAEHDARGGEDVYQQVEHLRGASTTSDTGSAREAAAGSATDPACASSTPLTVVTVIAR